MRSLLHVLCFVVVVSIPIAAVSAQDAAKPAAGGKGEKLFKQHCEMCHPGGGNIISSKKTLHEKDMKANNITTPEQIVKLMRKPGPGMTPFDAKTIPDKDAMEIAEYILKTY